MIVGEPLAESFPGRAVSKLFVTRLKTKEAIQRAVTVCDYNIERDGEVIQRAYQLIVNARGEYILGLYLANGARHVVFDTRGHSRLTQEGLRVAYGAVHDALYECTPSDAKIDFELTPYF